MTFRLRKNNDIFWTKNISESSHEEINLPTSCPRLEGETLLAELFRRKALASSLAKIDKNAFFRGDD